MSSDLIDPEDEMRPENRERAASFKKGKLRGHLSDETEKYSIGMKHEDGKKSKEWQEAPI